MSEQEGQVQAISADVEAESIQVKRHLTDNSVNIDVPVPGGLSLVVAVGLICATVFLILIGMGKVDVYLIHAQLNSHYKRG